MDSHERTFLSLNLEAPDRLPIDFWASEGFKRNIESHRGLSIGDLLDEHDVDLRSLARPEYVGPPLRRFPDGTEEDIWGIRRRTVCVPTEGGTETYEEVASPPLASATTVEEIEAYGRWTSPDWFDYGGIES